MESQLTDNFYCYDSGTIPKFRPSASSTDGPSVSKCPTATFKDLFLYLGKCNKDSIDRLKQLNNLSPI